MSMVDPSPETPSQPQILSIKQVSKWFGSLVAVSEVSLDIGPGVTGLLGSNGAGKTTLLRVMCGLAQPSEGEISILSVNPRQDPTIYRKIGVMSDHDAVYDHLTGREFVSMLARLRDVKNGSSMVDKAIDYVNLSDVQNRRISGYSRGMRQRIRFAGAIVHDPEVLLLDEPLNGTDPRQRLEFQDMFRSFADMGKIVVISSHILEELERITDSVIVMVSGKIAATGDHHGIRAAISSRPYNIQIICSEPRNVGAELLKIKAVDSATIDDKQNLVIQTRKIGDVQVALPEIAQKENARLTGFVPLDDSLESVFTYLAGS